MTPLPYDLLIIKSTAMKIVIETIPNDQQRYPTCGDWWFDDDGALQIRVSDMQNWKFEFLVGIHEAIEAMLCKDQGVPEANITAFDEKFEKLREQFPGLIGDQEPGDMVSAPYFHEHQFATQIEKQIANALQVNWDEYNSFVENL